jgi:hypothetical protein
VRAKGAMGDQKQRKNDPYRQAPDEVYNAIIVRTFAEVAAPIMAGIQPRNSCIAQARVVVEVMRRFRAPAEPLAFSLALTIPSAKFAYVSGLPPEEKARLRAQAATWSERPEPDGAPAWSGHVCTLVAGRWLIDTSLDQASAPERGVVIEPWIGVYPVPQGIAPEDLGIEATLGAGANGEHEAIVRYFPLPGREFLDTPAWEVDHIERPIELVCAAMESALRERNGGSI